MRSDVTVCIPTIPPRAQLLNEAAHSAAMQNGFNATIVAHVDTEGKGAAASRNAAFHEARTEWVAFLDDDDVFYPHHLATVIDYAEQTGADLVYPWFDLFEGTDPLAVRVGGQLRSPFGLPFGDEHAHYIRHENNFIPVTVLVRRETLMDVGGFPQPNSPEWPHDTCEDWGCWRRLLDAGATFAHAPHRTWRWRWHGGNTSGRPWK